MLFVCQWVDQRGDAPVEVGKFNAALLPLVVAFRGWDVASTASEACEVRVPSIANAGWNAIAVNFLIVLIEPTSMLNASQLEHSRARKDPLELVPPRLGFLCDLCNSRGGRQARPSPAFEDSCHATCSSWPTPVIGGRSERRGLKWT